MGVQKQNLIRPAAAAAVIVAGAVLGAAVASGATGKAAGSATAHAAKKPRADHEAPSKPGDLTATAVTQTSVSVSWTASTDDVGVAHYVVFHHGSPAAVTATTSATIDGLACGRNHAFSVAAVDTSGNHSGRTTLVISTVECGSPPPPPPDTEAPSAPGGLAATDATETSVTVSWNAATDNVGAVSYGLYRGGEKVGDTAVTTSTFGGLSCGKTYAFAVDAADAAENRSEQVPLEASTAECPADLFVAPNGGDFRWVHLAATYDGSTLRFFQNGAEVASTPTTGDIVSSDGRIQIGGESEANVWFNGLLDDVRIYDRALSDVEIRADMAAPAVSGASVLGLVAAYSFDDGSGATATDASGNHNDGVVANALWVTGRHGGALSFNGTNSAVVVANSSSLDFAAGMTLEAWVQPRALGGWTPVVAKEAPTDVAWAMYANTPENTPAAEVYTNGGATYARASAAAQLPSNDCSRADPCLTFDRAYHLAKPGQTVEAAGGTYLEQTITADPSKTSDSDVVIRPARGATVTLNGDLSISGSHLTVGNLHVAMLFVGYASSPTDVTLQDIDADNFNVYGGASFITFKGGDFGPSTCRDGHSGADCEAVIAASTVDGVTTLPHDIVFDGISMHDYQTASPAFHVTCMFIVSGYNIAIRNSKFRNCSVNDVFMQDWPGNGLHDVTMENNWFDTPRDHGVPQGTFTIAFSGRNNIVWTNFLVRNNTIMGIIEAGYAETAGWDNVRIVGNVGEFASCQQAPGLTWSHNFWNGRPCDPTDTEVAALGDLGLVDIANFDYHLKPDSPAVDKGDPSSFPATDIDGQTRPLGAAPDAGADEAR